MMSRAGRCSLLVIFTITAIWSMAGATPFTVGLANARHVMSGARNQPTTCSDANPGWTPLGMDLPSGDDPIEPGRVYRLSDGTLAVLIVATEVNDDGKVVSLDFAASLRISAAFVGGAGGASYIVFDPPVRSASGLTAPDNIGIDWVRFCYRIEVPGPPEPGATPVAVASPTETPTSPQTPAPTPTATAESFELGAVQTASALATQAAQAQATAATLATAAAASEATRAAERAAAEATTAALATERAILDATATAQANADSSDATATAEQQAAASATAAQQVAASATAEAANVAASATAEAANVAASATADAANLAASATADAANAAAQATAAAIATADAAQQIDLATAQAQQTESAATIAALQTAAAPSPTPADTTIYSASNAADFNGWSDLPDGWKVDGDLLVASGTDFTGYAQPPTLSIPDANYAVEAEIQISGPTDCAGNVGIVIRGSENGFYAGGLEWSCDSPPIARLWASSNPLGQVPVTIDDGWHTYRVEARGSQIRYLIDGAVVLEQTDETYPTGDQLALWSAGVKLTVRAYRVIDIA